MGGKRGALLQGMMMRMRGRRRTVIMTIIPDSVGPFLVGSEGVCKIFVL